MANMNAGIILAGQQPNFLNTIAGANEAAARQKGFQRQDQLNALYRDQGAAIAQGDQNALNALAAFDPNAALKVQTTRQGLRINEAELQMRRDQAARQATAWAQSQDDRTKAETAAKVQAGLMAAGQAFEAGDEAAFQQILKENGVEPFPMAEFPYHAAQYAGVLDALKAASEFGKPQPDFVTMDGQLVDKNAPGGPAVVSVDGLASAGPEWRPATPEEAARYGATGGQINQKTGKFVRTPKDSNMTIESDGKGGFRFVQGPGADGKGTSIDTTSPQAMISTIDGILSDPALEKSTGVLSFLQAIPGTDQRRFGARVKQLDGQAFLQAFQSLKGGGQITEIEGQKATEAIGRLDTAQKPEDYRQALVELRDILAKAANRPIGWAEQQSAEPPEAPTISDQSEYDALPSGTVFVAPDGTKRRKP